MGTERKEATVHDITHPNWRDETIVELRIELEKKQGIIDAVILQAQCWAGEAKGQTATVNEVGKILGGIPNWGPISKGVEQLRADKAELLDAARILHAGPTEEPYTGLSGEWLTGFYCGLEDVGAVGDSYQCGTIGYERGCERIQEWIDGELSDLVKKHAPTPPINNEDIDG